MSVFGKSRYLRRCLILCCIVGGIACAITVRLIDLHVVRATERDAAATLGALRIEELPPKRGLIMDIREEVLTNNIQHSELIVDWFYFNDPKVIASGLAYSLARHSDDWAELSDHEKDKRVTKYRTRLLRQAASKEKGKQEYNLAQILLDENTYSLGTSKNEEGKDPDRGKDKYDQEIARQYIRAYEEYVSKILAPHIEGMTYDEILDKIRQDGVEKPRKRIVVAKDLSEEKSEEIRQVLANARIRGVTCETVHKRHYAAPSSLTHITGYVGQLTEGSHHLSGVYGLEKQLDNYLQGVGGVRESREDSRGRIIPSKDDRFKSPVHGDNVKLTIDMELQNIVEEELDKGLQEFRSQRGTIIVVEPKTGSILAIASRPHFDLNTKANMQEGALNYAVQGLYEPGSTLKVVSAVAAVDSGKATFKTPIDCRTAPVPGTNPVSDGRRSFGTLPVEDVLRVSSNPGAYRLGCRVERGVYKKYLEAFGFNCRTNIDLPYEAVGMRQNLNNQVNFSRITYGYSIMVTPLQVAMAYAAIANDGVRMKPRLVHEIYTSEGVLKERREPQVAARVMKPETARNLRKALALVVGPGGTARRANVEGYSVGGKTGTADKVKEGGGYDKGRMTVSFAGMLPAHDPAFVCLVVIDDPRPVTGRPGGGSVAAPIFKNVASRLALALNIPKEGTIPSQDEKKRNRTRLVRR